MFATIVLGAIRHSYTHIRSVPWMQDMYKMTNAEQVSVFCKEFNKLSNIEKSETSLQAFFSENIRIYI